MNEITVDKKNWYRTFKIPKRSGGLRTIEAPCDEIKQDQRKILFNIMKMYAPSKYSFGGIKGRNITQAAKLHVNNKYKLKMDISDFFHSIHKDRVKKALSSNPEVPKEFIEGISELCTNQDGVLPMGAPTSMFLANVAVEKMYNAIAKVCSSMGLTFTAYVDDLVFSGNDPDKLWSVQGPVLKICKAYGLTIKPSKTVMMRQKQEVLGLCCTPAVTHTRLNKRKRNYIRGALHSIEKKLRNGESVPRKEINRLGGLVAFANMAEDQHSGRFNAAIMRIRELARRDSNNAV